MSIAATTVDVASIGSGANAIPAGNLQDVLSTLQGQTQWAADTAGAAKGTADWAADTAGAAKGTADWAAGKVGFLDYHLREIAALVNYTMPASFSVETASAEDLDFHVRQIAAKVGYEMPAVQVDDEAAE